MKKFWIMLLAIVMSVSLVGCKDKTEEKVEEKNNTEITTNEENEKRPNVKYEFLEDTVEIEYIGQHTVVYHFENNIVKYCDLIKTFSTEEAAIAYENSGEFHENAIVTREGAIVTVRNDYLAQNLTRTMIEEMAKAVAGN